MNDPEITVRRAETAEDGEMVLALIEQLAAFESLTPPDTDARRRFIADGFERNLPRFEAVLASVDGGDPCGYAIYFETYSTFLCRPTLYLEDIFVLPAQRKAGVGFALMRNFIEEAAARGCGRAEWSCLDWNTHAQRFYERLGAERLHEWFLYRMTAPEMERFLKGQDEPGG
jgi:GNAT superfamily N-acetyltransferase